jgi:Beta-galactosidase/beta-glucuronidase
MGGAESERLYLSGRDRADAVAWEFRCSSGARAGEWTTIPVPSNWEMHGFGTLSYHSATPSERGEYRHRFSLPEAWRGKRVRIVFDGVMTDARVTVNGQSAGPVHQGGFYRFSYDITRLVRFAEENVLEVEVDETSADEGVNRAERTGDYWNFGGIYRPVWLEAWPEQAIERVAIDARADGSFSLDAFIDGEGDAARVEVRLVDAVGREVAGPWSAEVAGKKVGVRGRMVGAALWTAETPNLYTAVTRLVEENGEVRHERRTRFGFRTFEVRAGDGFYLNGRRVVLQGANRHSFNARHGRALAEEDHREDIRLMKEMNFNAVRMSHYPPDERFLELCDEEGLYVLNELAGWQKSYDAEVGRRLVEEMIKRDVNHPSVVLWDNGNEGGWNTELDGEFAKWDPQGRAVLHPWEVFSGVNTAHYRLFDQLPALVAGQEIKRGAGVDRTPITHEHSLIYLPTEFLHGLFDGGAGAGMEDYWAMMRSGKTFGGGFVWVFRDEGVLRPDTGKIDVVGNRAPDGIVGPLGEKEGSFYTLKELWSPIVVSESGILDTFDGTLTVENRHSFTDASACRFVWELRILPEAGAADAQVSAVAAGVATSPQIAPGETGRLRLNLPASWRTADVLALRVEDPRGRELWTYTWALPGVKRFAEAMKAESGEEAGEFKVTEQRGTVVASARRMAAAFDRATGALVELVRDGRRLSLGAGLRPAAGAAQLVSFETKTEGGDFVARSRYTGGLESVEWRVRANGWVECAYVYPGIKDSVFQGVSFDLPGVQVRGKTWAGNGPYRVWQNRLRGVTLGAWSNDYNETITGWSGFEYPEFKGFFSGVRWLTLETSSGRLTVVPQEGLYVQVMKPDLPPAEWLAKTAVAMPEADVSVLHVIPAIGTKFSWPEEGGPQGVTPEAQEVYRGWFALRVE